MYLLDTNLISELRKLRQRTANPGLVAWADSVSPQDLYLSAITIEELERGVLLAAHRDPPKGLALRSWLEHQVLPAFEGRIIPVDTAVARRSAKLQVPDPFPIRDSLIAATALVHSMVVVTRNTADFERSGATLLNPWTGEASSGA
jgi:predicted nucleic acid-binding protein